jgi:hypothetical protein
MNDAEAHELAEAHWEYIEKICRVMYTDAFIHGIKHGQENRAIKKPREFKDLGTCLPYEIKK